MSLRASKPGGVSPSARPSSVTKDAARAKRARDHLARKRQRERERLERERSRVEIDAHRQRLRGILTPLLFGLALGLGILFAQPVSERLFLHQASLERVAVQGARALSPATIARDAGLRAGQRLATIDGARLREGLTAEPWIASARTLLLPTGTLVISVVERRAIARWRLDEASAIELIDQDGAPFAGALEPGGDLPLVRGEVSPHGGLPDEALEILQAVRRHAPFADDPTTLTLHLPAMPSGAADDDSSVDPDQQSGYVLEIGEGGPRVLLGRRLFSQRVARLAALLEYEEAALQDARWVDLRFADRAVLRAGQPASG